MIQLYDTQTRTKALFAPIDPSAVRLYVCGPTVWDFAHIGNARPVVVFDLLFRLLRRVYGTDHVIYARNITDIDDKINARAARAFPALPLNEAIARVTAPTKASRASFACARVSPAFSEISPMSSALVMDVSQPNGGASMGPAPP